MEYAWFIWSAELLVIWLAIFFALRSKRSRRKLVIVSFWTALLGATEPLFVPAYWNPPSLFNLARTTGFDIESFLFAFSMGGVSVLYDLFFPIQFRRMTDKERAENRHRFHLLALLSAPLAFVLLQVFTNLNPIYNVIISLALGSGASAFCRTDLIRKMLVTGPVFLVIYFLYFLTLTASFPGYVRLVWNLDAISGVLVAGVPMEELLFALVLGFYWASIYEHITMVKMSALKK